MLTFNVKKEWFEKIKNGEKTHEYREVKDYWIDRLVKDPVLFASTKYIFLDTLRHKEKDYYEAKIQFMNGMLSEKIKPRIYAKMKSIKIINGLNTDLKTDKPVFDIEFEVISK